LLEENKFVCWNNLLSKYLFLYMTKVFRQYFLYVKYCTDFFFKILVIQIYIFQIKFAGTQLLIKKTFGVISNLQENEIKKK